MLHSNKKKKLPNISKSDIIDQKLASQFTKKNFFNQNDHKIRRIWQIVFYAPGLCQPDPNPGCKPRFFLIN